MSIPQKQKDRERRKKLKHRKPTMSEMPIPTTKVFKDKRRKSRQQEKINLYESQIANLLTRIASLKSAA